MIAAEEIITVARSYVGTPFKHQGRSRSGTDCIGLLVVVAKDLGVCKGDYLAYAKNYNSALLIEMLDRFLVKTPLTDLSLGRIAVFWLTNPQKPKHVAIVSDYGIIHYSSHVGRIVETRFCKGWRARLWGAYEFCGVN